MSGDERVKHRSFVAVAVESLYARKVLNVIYDIRVLILLTICSDVAFPAVEL